MTQSPNRCGAIFALAAFTATPCLALQQNAEPQDEIEEIVVTADLGSLPGDDMGTVFGFDKSILQTPRSASTVTDEMMDRFIVSDIDELIALTPGSFTQSFFGVAGTLDIRGTPGETYFRGMRRLDNPGNYPTPLAASSHVDIVRGPASPIHGPAKIGGYLNFTPKSAHANPGDAFEGTFGLELGSWARRVANAEVGGPGRLAGQDFGYHLYAEVEDSGSYYRDTATDQTILQASVDVHRNRVELQFGGMYHHYDGNENAGWNRLTQALIDTGTYVTGVPRPLDTDGDGYISHQEFDIDGDGFTDLNPFAAGLAPGTQAPLDASGPFPGACRIGATLVFGCRPELLALVAPGTARLSRRQVAVDPDDILRTEVVTLFFDVIVPTDSGWEWRNKMFYEAYDHLSEVAYGFSQFHDTWVFENKLVVANRFVWDEGSVAVQISPSLRLTDFAHGDDYTNEYFDRRDLTRPASALDRRLLATQIDDDYTDYFIGKYLDLGFAVMLDMDWRQFNVVAGARYDHIDMDSRQPLEKLLLPSARNFCLDASCVALQADDQVQGVSWTFSLSYAFGPGLIPYFTASRQATVIAGQGAELTTFNVAAGRAFDESRLLELGLKGSLLDDRLYFAAALYEQERVDFHVQQIVTNQATRTEGLELELRWMVNHRLLLSFGYSNIEVVNLNTLDEGGRFSFIGADDVPGLAPGAIYGGALSGVIRPAVVDARRAGMPEHIWSVTATYDFGHGLAASASMVDVAATHSGFSRSVALPSYRLVNAGVVFERGNWLVAAAAKNLTNERYFRANFPNLFGGVVALPELPRHYAVRISYRW